MLATARHLRVGATPSPTTHITYGRGLSIYLYPGLTTMNDLFPLLLLSLLLQTTINNDLSTYSTPPTSQPGFSHSATSPYA